MIELGIYIEKQGKNKWMRAINLENKSKRS